MVVGESGWTVIEIIMGKQSTENQALLNLSIDGDGEAYGQLFMNYYVALIRFAWPMLGVQEDAEDAVHDAFLKSWTRLHRFDHAKGQFGTWIFAITRNCCLDKLRQRKKCGPACEFKDMEFDSRPDREAVDPARAVLNRDCRDEVLILISGLSDKYRETIVLYYWNELSVKEISDITQTSESNVKSRLGRGRQQLAVAYCQLHSLAIEEVPSVTALFGDLPTASYFTA